MLTHGFVLSTGLVWPGMAQVMFSEVEEDAASARCRGSSLWMLLARRGEVQQERLRRQGHSARDGK